MRTEIARLSRGSRWVLNLKITRNAVVMVVFLLLASNYANATNQRISGKKLLLKSSGKLVLLSKAPSINNTGSDPVGGADSSVSFNDGSSSMTFSLPKTGWSTNGSTTVFKYKNASAPGGPSPVKIAIVNGRSGLLKVIAKDLPFAVPNGAATIDVVFSLDGGTNTYCMTFSGTGDGNKFLVKDAPPPATCPGGGAVCGGPYPACGGTCPAGQVCWPQKKEHRAGPSCGRAPAEEGCACVAGPCNNEISGQTCSDAGVGEGACPVSGETCLLDTGDGGSCGHGCFRYCCVQNGLPRGSGDCCSHTFDSNGICICQGINISCFGDSDCCSGNCSVAQICVP